MAESPGLVLWFTGLSGAGKSTLANLVAAALREQNLRVEVLDGDDIRTNLSKGLGFSKEDRDTNIRRIGWVARVLARNGVVAITAAISPYRSVRDEVRSAVEAEGCNFVEVWVNAALDTLIARDTKGLYRKALAGELPGFTGVSDPYEEPVSADLVVCTDQEAPGDSAERVLSLCRTAVQATATH